MSLARVKTWVPGEVLTAADLNGEFNNILNNPTALISPFTANLNANSKQITNLVLETLGATPAAGTQGRIEFQTALKLVEIDDGTAMSRIPMVKTSQVSSTGGIGFSDGVLTKAWVVFAGNTTSSQITPSLAYGVSTSANSIVKNGIGDYTIPLLTQMANAFYPVSITVNSATSNATLTGQVNTLTTASMRIMVLNSTANQVDPAFICVTAWGPQV